MDIKARITEAVEKIKNDKDLMKKFQEDPIKTVESILGVDLPDDTVKKLTEGIKAKLSADKLAGGLDSLKKLF